MCKDRLILLSSLVVWMLFYYIIEKVHYIQIGESEKIILKTVIGG